MTLYLNRIRVNFIVLYVLFAIADLITTLVGLSLGHAELNPIAAEFLRLGSFGIIIYKTVVTYVLIYLVYNYWHKRGVRCFAYIGLSLLVITVINNIIKII